MLSFPRPSAARGGVENRRLLPGEGRDTPAKGSYAPAAGKMTNGAKIRRDGAGSVILHKKRAGFFALQIAANRSII